MPGDWGELTGASMGYDRNAADEHNLRVLEELEREARKRTEDALQAALQRIADGVERIAPVVDAVAIGATALTRLAVFLGLTAAERNAIEASPLCTCGHLELFHRADGDGLAWPCDVCVPCMDFQPIGAEKPGGST